MTTVVELQTKLDKLTTNMDRLDHIVNDANPSHIAVDSATVPSVATLLHDVEETTTEVANAAADAALGTYSAAVQAAASDAEAAKTAAESAADSATSSKNAASASESAAAASAASALSSKNAAAASEAAADADAQSTSIDVALAVAARQAAEAARDATLASFDSFDDRYLGPKESNPTADNDGAALVAGMLYFNTVSGAMMVYTGLAWAAAYVSGTGYLPLSGGSITGPLTLAADPSASMDAATKSYVDTRTPATLMKTDTDQTMTAKLATLASSTEKAGMSLPHGTAPTTPSNGDIWTTTTNLLIRMNGTTRTVMFTSGGTFSGKVTTYTPASGGAGLNLPHGTSPSAPVNGDLWTTSTALKVQINGATKDVAFVGHTHTLSEITDAGTAAALNTGTGAGQVVVLDGSAKLPAVDGSALTNLPSAQKTLTYTISSAVASVDVDLTDAALTGCTQFKIYLLGIVPSTDAVSLYARTSSDGTNFASTAGDYSHSGIYETSGLSGSIGNSAAQFNLSGATLGNQSNEFFFCELNVFEAKNSSVPTGFVWTIGGKMSTPHAFGGVSGGLLTAANETKKIRFLCSSGNIASGKIIAVGTV